MNHENLIYDIVNYYAPNTVSVGQTTNFRCVVHGHDETPSARIFPQSRMYKCYACHCFGGPLKIIKLIENFESSKDARDFIFKTFGVKLTQEERQQEASMVKTYRNVIEELVISTRHPRFNKIYYELDKAVEAEDENRLKELYAGLVNYSNRDLATQAAPETSVEKTKA